MTQSIHYPLRRKQRSRRRKRPSRSRNPFRKRILQSLMASESTAQAILIPSGRTYHIGQAHRIIPIKSHITWDLFSRTPLWHRYWIKKRFFERTGSSVICHWTLLSTEGYTILCWQLHTNNLFTRYLLNLPIPLQRIWMKICIPWQIPACLFLPLPQRANTTHRSR